MNGTERIAAAFGGCADSGKRAAFMPYLMGGFPDLDASAAIGEAYADGGADLVELGVPFSDPLADGPVIQAAGTAALAAGATVDGVLGVAERLAGRVQYPRWKSGHHSRCERSQPPTNHRTLGPGGGRSWRTR